MPLLTAAIIVCGALPSKDYALGCRAQVYHGIQAEQKDCAKAVAEDAKDSEEQSAANGLVRTSSHAECFYASDEGSIIFYLPEFMQSQLGASTSRVVEYDVVGDSIVERAPDASTREVGL